MAHKRKPRVHVGCKVKFDPMNDLSFSGCKTERGSLVTGVVSYINSRNRWFLVEYSGLKTSFHFSDLGNGVFVVGA